LQDVETSTLSPVLRDVYTKELLVPHAFQRVAKQASLALLYKVVPIADHDTPDVPLWDAKFEVSYIAPPTGARRNATSFDESLRFDSLGPLPPHVLEYDLSAHSENRKHIVTLARGCSCQQTCCSGLPDRHVLAVWQHLLSTGVDMSSRPPNFEETIAPIWLARNHADATRAARLDDWRREQMLGRSRASERAGGSSSASARATPAELERYALAQLRPLAALAAQQGETAVDHFLSDVRKLKSAKQLVAGALLAAVCTSCVATA